MLLILLGMGNAAVLLNESFAVSDLVERGWRDVSQNSAAGSYEIKNKMLHFSQKMEKSAWLTNGIQPWGDVRISMKLRTRFPEGKGLLIIAGRCRMETSRTDATYAGWALSGEGGLKSMLVSAVGGKHEIIRSDGIDNAVFAMDVWHDLVLEIRSGMVRVILDGKELCSGSGTLAAQGGVLLSNGFGAETWIEKLKVESF